MLNEIIQSLSSLTDYKLYKFCGEMEKPSLSNGVYLLIQLKRDAEEKSHCEISNVFLALSNL